MLINSDVDLLSTKYRTPSRELHGTRAPRGKQAKWFFLEQLLPPVTFHNRISQLETITYTLLFV